MNQLNKNVGQAGREVQEQTFFLADLIGARAYMHERKIGKVQDLVAVDRGKLAEVTHVQIGRPYGDPALFVPLAKVRSLNAREIVLDIEAVGGYVRPLASDEVLLKDHLLDKKVLDIEEQEVEVVYDMRLVLTGEKVYVSDVDISRFGLLRQLGLKSLSTYLYRRAAETKKQLIPWSYIEPLPTDLGTLQGNVKLSVLKEKLADIHPVDLADILEELDSDQRVTLLEGLDTEHASDTLEEVDPAVQRDIVFSLRKERAAQLIGEMTPGQAADIVSVLPADQKRAILKLLEPAQAAKIEEILEKQDVNILNFTTQEFFKCPPEMSVGQARTRFRESARNMDVMEYFYILSEANKLSGVVDIKEVFMAEDQTLLKDLMVESVISLNPG